jgi:hypothetical protein
MKEYVNNQGIQFRGSWDSIPRRKAKPRAFARGSQILDADRQSTFMISQSSP